MLKLLALTFTALLSSLEKMAKTKKQRRWDYITNIAPTGFTYVILKEFSFMKEFSLQDEDLKKCFDCLPSQDARKTFHWTNLDLQIWKSDRRKIFKIQHPRRKLEWIKKTWMTRMILRSEYIIKFILHKSPDEFAKFIMF